MFRYITIAVLALCYCAQPSLAQQSQHAGEEPVDAYEIRPENAGTTPIGDPRVFAAFGGELGLARLVDNFTDRLHADPRISDIFRAIDEARFRRTLKEQFCFILGGPCVYTGRDLTSAHENEGITTREFNALVEDLQLAMSEEGIPFRMQNKLIGKLAPMRRNIVTR